MITPINLINQINNKQSIIQKIELDIMGLKNSNPVIDVFEFKIDGYYQSSVSNTFSKGFTNAKSEQCGLIKVDEGNKSVNDNTDKSSCDVLDTKDDIKIIWNESTALNEINDMYINIGTKYKIDSIEDVKEINESYDFKFCNSNLHTQLHSIIKSLIDEIYMLEINTFNNNTNDKIIIEYVDKLDSYIYNWKLDKNDKVIIIGDIHGSFHTFYRLLCRFHRFGILNLEKWKINDGYKIIFLGDVIDRGNFSLEIVYCIFRLLMINNTLETKKIIFNRGNHEEITTNNSYGFTNEINQKCCNKYKNSISPKYLCEKGEKLYMAINKLFTHFPSAVLLEMNGNKYWLSHGGFPIKYAKTKIPNFNNNMVKLSSDKNEIKYYEGGVTHYMNNSHETRWNDFYYSSTISDYLPNPRRGSVMITQTGLKNFLELNDIKFVFRGHQDSVANTYIFANMGSDSAYIVHDPKNNNIDEVEFSKNKYSYAKIHINKFNKNSNDMFKMVTVSTNTDNYRPFTADSFVILSDKNDNFNMFNKLNDLPVNNITKNTFY